MFFLMEARSDHREAFDEFRPYVLPVFWPVLWLSLAWLIRSIETRRSLGETGMMRFYVTWYGAVRMRSVIAAQAAPVFASAPCWRTATIVFDHAPWEWLARPLVRACVAARRASPSDRRAVQVIAWPDGSGGLYLDPG